MPPPSSCSNSSRLRICSEKRFRVRVSEFCKCASILAPRLNRPVALPFVSLLLLGMLLFAVLLFAVLLLLLLLLLVFLICSFDVCELSLCTCMRPRFLSIELEEEVEEADKFDKELAEEEKGTSSALSFFRDCSVAVLRL